MSAAVCAFLLTFSTLCGPTVVSGVLSAPTNVRLTSYNLNLVLRWDAPEQPASGLLYTTEYRATRTDYAVGCVNISTLECDFTRLPNVSILEYGKYTGRVRVQRGTESSTWMESKLVALDKDTTIGPPSVSLLSHGATIEVSIRDPVFAISALRDVYGSASYNITYWKDGQREKVRNISNMQQNRAVLDLLDPQTMYCVQVQLNTMRNPNPNPSEPSAPVCLSSASDGEAPWVAAVLTFVVMAMAVALVAVAVVYRKNISHFLCPKDVLPPNFKKILLLAPNSSMYPSSHPAEELYDRVSIITDSRTVEEEESKCTVLI